MNIISPEILAFTGLLYVTLLFYIAWLGDNLDSRRLPAKSGLIYSLSIAVYCSSWTFFGAVGTASSRGWDFFAIYLGPILVFLLGSRLIQRIIRISKQQNITSVSDFISSRYGKSRMVAILVTVVAVLGSLPYISLQLQAIAMAFGTVTSESIPEFSFRSPDLLSDTAFYSTIMLAVFTILFGTRHLDATEHHRGLIQAIALESVVKLLAILAVGYFCLTLLGDIAASGVDISWTSVYSTDQENGARFSSLDFAVRLILSTTAILFLPRQFHVTVVEAESHHMVRSARWLFPAYLILISIAVIPIAIAGNHLLPGNTNADLFILHLPLAHGQNLLTTVVFIGGISAATGMVIVAAIAISTMVCNDIVMPILIHVRRLNILERPTLSRTILTIRRIIIVVILFASYGYYWLSETNQGLADIGLISFAAIMQFAPAALMGLYWRSANKGGAVTGLMLGFLVWSYCLLFPTLMGAEEVNRLFQDHAWIHPNHLFGMEGLSPLAHGVIWSMILNIGGLVFGSILYRPSLLDKIQASVFLHATTGKHSLHLERGSRYASIGDARTLCHSILGEDDSRRIFGSEEFGAEPHRDSEPISPELVQKIEQSIASVIGASSARHVVARTLLGQDIWTADLVMLMDETTQAITFNREVLESGFENISQGVRVIDQEQKLVAWNSRYRRFFNFPEGFLHVGMPVEEVLRHKVESGEYGDVDGGKTISSQMERFRNGVSYSDEWRKPDGRYIRSQGNPMPGGGFVTSYTDITDTVNAEELLRKANERLETRVTERTRDLEDLNRKLQQATEGKTRFLAAASHDLLQPINAARLFNQSIVEQGAEMDPTIREMTAKVDRSLVNADRLLRALLDISKLDGGTITPELTVFDLYDVLEELLLEMEPLARRKGLALRIRKCHAGVYSDRRLVRSMLQNLITNAIRYTTKGSVLVGCRRHGKRLRLEVWDTGIGIREEDLDKIFQEFQQVHETSSREEDRGLGLGLAITQRLSRILDHPVNVTSRVGHGSRFSFTLPKRPLEHYPKPRQITWSSDSQLDGLRVLCLEDSPEVLEAMESLLQRWGCMTTTCPDIPSARAALKETRPEVVIADYNLEDTVTGLDLLREVSVSHPEIQYRIVISAEQDPSIRSQTRAEGIFFFPKPVNPSSLRLLLKRARADRRREAVSV